jgi:hypothetical protein
MRKLLFIAVLLGTSSAFAQCPIGSFPSVDNWGNQICKTFNNSTSTIQGSLDNCPVGSHPFVDNWGNRICQTFGSGTRYYDTSGGCPIGTFPGVDSWGNQTCKSF